jgi:hypothetical protein
LPSQLWPVVLVLLDAQSRNEKFDQVTRVVARVAARPNAEIPDTAEQFVGIQAGSDLSRRSRSLKKLSTHGDQAIDEVGVQRLEGDLVGGNLTGLSNDLTNGLTTVLGAYLNGYPIECDACTLDPSGGLLTGPSVGFGGIENIILALQSIATDIGAPAPAAATEAVDSLVSGASLGLPDLSTLATDISGVFDPSTALADFSNLVTGYPVGSPGRRLRSALGHSFPHRTEPAGRMPLPRGFNEST